MTYGAIGLPETATMAEAAETMLKARISGVLVHDADNALVGVLSEGDLMRRSEIGAERKRPRWLEVAAQRRPARRILRPQPRPQDRRDHDAQDRSVSPRTPSSASRST